MDFYKIIIIVLFGGCISSCDNVSKTEHDELKERYELLQEASKSTDTKIVQQYKDINKIFEKIESVSGSIIIARKNIEGISLSQVEKINIHIESIDKELSSLRSSANKKNSPELYKTIEHLQKTLINKQKEIDLLKEDLRNKDKEILVQGKTIEQQQEEIEDQRRKIEEQRLRIEKQQALQWHEMGLLLYNISTRYEQGSKGFLGINKGNYKKMIENKKELLKESKFCFEEAVKKGVDASKANLEIVNTELTNLNYRYNRLDRTNI